MDSGEKTVVRFKQGRLLKGHLKSFSASADAVTVLDAETSQEVVVPIDDLKAVFFVRSLEGDRQYREKKMFGSTPKGRRVFVKFRDGECLVGFLDGEVPWEKGFFISKMDPAVKGFFLMPVDEGSNNRKVFVVASSVEDVTVVPAASNVREEFV